MKARVRLFRGEYAVVWERRFVAAGWPSIVAKRLSLFVTGDQKDVPRFMDLPLLPDDPTAGRRIVEP